MSENAQENIQKPADKKSVPAPPKKIRIIGGPEIEPPLDVEFQQKKFTLQGLSEITELEEADTIVYWPSPDLFDPKAIAIELIDKAAAFEEGSELSSVYGLRVCKRIETHNGKTNSSYWLEDCHCAFDGLAKTLNEHLSFALAHKAALQKGKWPISYYKNWTGNKDPRSFIRDVLMALMRASFWAAKRGAAVAVVVPAEFAPHNPKSKTPSIFPFAYDWLSQLIRVHRVASVISERIDDAAPASPHYKETMKLWSSEDTNLKMTFSILRTLSSGTRLTTSSGVFRPAEIAPVAIEKNLAITVSPGRINKYKKATSLVFHYGSGGLVLMPAPVKLESLLGIAAKFDPIKKLILTTDSPPSKWGKSYYLVHVIFASGIKKDVPLVPQTFLRFLAFCVASLLALKKQDNTLALVDALTMTVAGHGLGAFADPADKDYPFKLRNTINLAFAKILKNFVDCKIISESSGHNKYSLDSILWKTVDIAQLRNRFKHPDKNETPDEAKIREIISVLN